jgi:pre-60S factor REI1
VLLFCLAGVAGTRPAPMKPSAVSQEESKPQNSKAVLEGEDDDSDDEWEEVDGDETAADEDEDTIAEMDEAGPSDDGVLSGDWDASDCLFCGKNQSDFERCIEHMHKVHGFFIPDVEYLKDPIGLLRYLGLKITKGYMCLYCDEQGKQFHSVEAVRKHMDNKSHCKLRYGDGEGAEDENIDDYYDFSSSYKTSENTDMVLHNGVSPTVSLSAGGHELVIKGSGGDENSVKRIGSRDMARYFRQKPAPTENRDGFAANALIAKYRSMGLATQDQKWRLRNKPEEQQRKASQRAEYIRSKIALKNNVIRNLPRNCEF